MSTLMPTTGLSRPMMLHSISAKQACSQRHRLQLQGCAEYAELSESASASPERVKVAWWPKLKAYAWTSGS